VDIQIDNIALGVVSFEWLFS